MKEIYFEQLVENIRTGVRNGIRKGITVFLSTAETETDTRLFSTKDVDSLISEMEEDANFLYENDPAAENSNWVIRLYNSFAAVALYRIASFLYKNENAEVKFVARQMMEFVHSKYGIDIHPRTSIAVPFAIDHGTGVVIGETTVIGPRCLLYHGVTLGASRVNRREQVGAKRHPTLGEGVVVYSNASILGDLTIADNTIVAGDTTVYRNKAGEIVGKIKERN